MDNELFVLLLVMLGFVACFALILGTAALFDRIAVTIMRAMDIRLFPLAIGIAVSITEHPEEWSADTHRMRHRVIGSIWTANGAYGLHVETESGKWKPGLLERRIIRDAVDWRIHGYVRDKLIQAARRGRITA